MKQDFMKKILTLLFIMLPTLSQAQILEQILQGAINSICRNCSGEGCYSCNYTGYADRSSEAFRRGFNQGYELATQKLPDGHHVVTLENGVYDGEYKDGMRNGKGTYTFNNGEKYIGDWKDGHMHGKGYYITVSKYTYEGDFVNDLMEGQGVLEVPNGNKYVGGFKAGLMHGEGTIYIPSKKTYQKVIMENGKQISVIEEGVYDPAGTSTKKGRTNAPTGKTNTQAGKIKRTPTRQASGGTGDTRPIKKHPYKTSIDPTYKGEINQRLPPNVVFKQGESSADDVHLALVEMVSRHMESHPGDRVLILGYTSTDAEARQAQQLSEARAMAVKQVLVRKYGIDANRLIANGKGATDKVSETPAFNRCVCFYIIP